MFGLLINLKGRNLDNPSPTLGPKLTDYHTQNMVFQMKTTLNIDERLMVKVKQEAARQGRTMTEFIESALRLALQSSREKTRLTSLPTFRGGPFRANVADNDALQDLMEGR
jgi:hypothetical protein